MNAKEMAAKLNGREYRDEIEDDESAEARRCNLVVAFGASDDLLELRGAIEDEVGAYDGTTCGIDVENHEIMPSEDSDDFCPKCRSRAKIALITAEWCPKEPKASWLITADVPFEPFDIMEDGELYCRGAVIDLGEALKAESKAGVV